MLYCTLYHPEVMLIKCQLDRYQMRVRGMLGREVLTLGTTGGGKGVEVDGGVVEGDDATVVHTTLRQEAPYIDFIPNQR